MLKFYLEFFYASSRLYHQFQDSDGSARIRCTHMSQLASRFFLALRSWETSLGAARLPIAFPATRYHTGSMPPPPSSEIQNLESGNTEPVGLSGRSYMIERVIQEKKTPPRRVYLATTGNQKYVLKEVPKSDFKYFQDMHRKLGSCPYLRLAQDAIPEQSMFVYKYFTDDLLSLVQKDLPITLMKRILKDTLRGLAALHDQNIVDTDVKANNILVEQNDSHGEIVIEQTQLADIEDAAYVPPGSDIVGRQVGNWMWRSPEAHAQGPINKPSDIFSFGVTRIYAVLKRVIFAVDKEELAQGDEPLAIVLERQISYFADEDGLNGLLKHLGESPWCEVLKVIRTGFNETNPRKPFSLWKNIDPDFKDLIGGLTNFEPAKRLTAHEALAHRWFRDI